MGRNNFGLLRLFLAAAVVVSHSSELIYGNRSHEPITQIFHTMSLGELAVGGFFIVSGFLVTQSYINSRSPFDYLRKRIFRIYPAFVVASLLCLVAVAPFSGATALFSILQDLRNIALLTAVEAPGAFHALHYPALDGPMWTIRFEFRCYILVALFGLLGLFRRKYAILCLTAVLLFVHGWLVHEHYPMTVSQAWPDPVGFAIFIDPISAIWLVSLFCTGMSFCLFRGQMGLTRQGMLLCMTLMLLCLSVPSLAGPGFAVFGGYILLWFGSHSRFAWVPHRPNEVDISYGLYLYAWPIMSLIILHVPSITPVPLAVVTFGLSVCAGFLSWHLVERPAARVSRFIGYSKGFVATLDPSQAGTIHEQTARVLNGSD